MYPPPPTWLDKLFTLIEKYLVGTDQIHPDLMVRQRVILLFLISIIGSLILAVFGTAALNQDNLLLGYFDLTIAFLLLLNLLDVRFRKDYHFNILVGLTLAALLFSVLYIHGGFKQSGHVFYLTFPLIASFAIGSFRGALAALLMLLPIIFLLITNVEHPFISSYPVGFEVRFLVAYVLITIMAYLFEHAKEKIRLEIILSNQSLEAAVEQRTTDLRELTIQLQQRIGQYELAKTEIEISESKFQNIMELSVVGILTLSPKGVINEANKRICELADKSRDALVGSSFEVFPFTRESVETDPFMPEDIKVGERVIKEREIIGGDGKLIHVEVRVAKMPDSSFQVAFTDISHRKRVESALKDSEERFRTLHNASFGGIAIHDMGVILDCNQGLCDLTGFKREELIGSDGLELIAPHWRTEVREKIRSGYDKPYEVEGLRKDGSSYPLSVMGKNIPYRKKNRRVTEFRDLSEQKTAEVEKLKLEEQLFQSRKMESVGQLAGGVAHDFNNMLSVIIGHVELALIKNKSQQPIGPDLEKIKLAAERSAEVTGQLLAFARKQSIDPQPIDLNVAVTSMVSMLKRLVGEDISLKWTPSELLWKVRIDKTQLDQILINLCANARDAITGAGEIEVRTSNATMDEVAVLDEHTKILEDFVKLSVRDSGIGIEERNQETIFEPFYTTKEVGAGTGLGLATVYGSVKQNAGYITVESELDKGSLFSIYFPRYQGEVAEQSEANQTIAAIGGNETILLVEDEPAILSMCKELLTMLGYRVLAYESPIRAREELTKHQHHIDLLLTDVVMPEMNGYNLAVQIKEQLPHVRTLYISGYTKSLPGTERENLSDQELVQKPFTQVELAMAIRKVLDKEVGARGVE